MSADLLRNLSLLLPVTAVLVAGCVAAARHGGRLPERTVPAAALATVAAWTGLLAVELTTARWSFAPAPTTVLGMPLETSLGWALAWGALPVLAGGRVAYWLAGFAWADVLVMPRLEPLVTLRPGWLLGEALLLAVVAAPVLLLGRWTRTRRHVELRAGAQAVVFGTLFLGLVPTLVLQADRAAWPDALDHSYPVRAALLAGVVLVGVPALAAVAELARVGGGTPFPWDPPDRLVTTGPYAYLANPMQVSIVLLYVLLAMATGSWFLLIGAAVAACFCATVAGPHERLTMRERWTAYDAWRREVPAWIPRWHPHVARPATLWVAEDCPVCRATGQALERLGPRDLTLRDAADAGVRMTRMRWTDPVTLDRGAAAFARALEHTVLPWAWFGWMLRLPGVTWVVQAVLDACGLGPRQLDTARTETG